MKTRISNAKNFVRTHSHKLATAAGAAAGVAVTYHLMTNSHHEIWCAISTEQAQKLMENSESCVQFVTSKDIINVFVDPA